MEPLDRYAPPAAEELKPLGSLAQAARNKEIRQAQWALIAIGVLTLLVNGFLLYNIPNEIRMAAQQNNVGAEQMEQFRQTVTIFGYMIYGGAALLGVVFVILGLIVKAYPVPITITGLVLYVAATLGFALLNPVSLLSGVIVKVIIVLALVRAIKAARAYESDTKKATAAGLALE